jgi:hypothetical protein
LIELSITSESLGEETEAGIGFSRGLPLPFLSDPPAQPEVKHVYPLLQSHLKIKINTEEEDKS